MQTQMDFCHIDPFPEERVLRVTAFSKWPKKSKAVPKMKRLSSFNSTVARDSIKGYDEENE